jgi:hypothetical protein
MSWRKRQKNYIDSISEMLEDLGIGPNSQRRLPDPDRVVAYLATRSGKRFDVNFFMDGTDLVYESVVEKAVSGRRDSALLFYQTLLAYNATISKMGFALVASREGWMLILKGTQEYRHVDADFLCDLIQYYEFVYSRHVERIKQLADELGLEFDGKLDEALRAFVEGVIE